MSKSIKVMNKEEQEQYDKRVAGSGAPSGLTIEQLINTCEKRIAEMIRDSAQLTTIAKQYGVHSLWNEFEDAFKIKIDYYKDKLSQLRKKKENAETN